MTLTSQEVLLHEEITSSVLSYQYRHGGGRQFFQQLPDVLNFRRKT